MRKILLLTVLLGLILSACNYPAGGSRPSSTPNAEEVATHVSVLLTAQPSSTPPPAAATSFAPEATATVEVIATATRAPVSPTPAPSATLSPGDPKAGLGEPAWKNNFDTGKGFALETPYEDDNVRFAVENNMLVMTGRQDNGWHSWRLTSPKVQDYYLEAATHTMDCSGEDIYGLVVRAPDFESGQGYYFGVTCDGRYNLAKWQDQGLVSMISLTKNEAIQAGSNRANTLGVKLTGSRIALYANGKLLQEIDDDTFVAAGYFGVWIAANRTPGFTVEVDQMSLWK